MRIAKARSQRLWPNIAGTINPDLAGRLTVALVREECKPPMMRHVRPSDSLIPCMLLVRLNLNLLIRITPVLTGVIQTSDEKFMRFFVVVTGGSKKGKCRLVENIVRRILTSQDEGEQNVRLHRMTYPDRCRGNSGKNEKNLVC